MLLIEPFALSSAVMEYLAPNSDLHVVIAGEGDKQTREVGRGHRARPTVNVTLKNAPLRFQLTLVGHHQAVEYGSLEPMVRYLAAYASGEPDVWPARVDAPIAASRQRTLQP